MPYGTYPKSAIETMRDVRSPKGKQLRMRNGELFGGYGASPAYDEKARKTREASLRKKRRRK